MVFAYKEKCEKLVTEFSFHINELQIDAELKKNSLKTIQDFLEASTSEVDNAAVAFKFNAFVLEFGEYLCPGGIVLSHQASEIWHQIMDLFSSSETRRRIQPFSF